MSKINYVIPTSRAICNLFDKGMESEDIIMALDLPKSYVNRVVSGHKSGLVMRRRALASAKVMTEMRNTGMTNKEISKEMGVCYGTVRNNIGKQPKELVKISQKIAAQKRRLNEVSKAMRHATMLAQQEIKAEVQLTIAD